MTDYTADDVRAWLATTGGSWEMRVARTMNLAGLGIANSHYYVDLHKPAERPREVDVVASSGLGFGENAVLGMFAVIEGKYAREPFVIYRNTPAQLGGLFRVNRLASKLGQACLEKARFIDPINSSPMWMHESDVGYALATAKVEKGAGVSKQNDDQRGDLAFLALEA